jgi:uncharacterized protein (TIGR04255 family)
VATNTFLATPFGSEPFNEVPLPRAPLAQTLAQIQFPAQSVLTVNDDVANGLALRLRQNYPVLNVARQVSLILTPEGAQTTTEGAKVWRLSSADESWQLSFTSNFLTLSTSRYTNRDDFCTRLGAAWTTFAEVVDHPAIQRIGFRYINRVDNRDFLENLAKMVRPEVLGATLVGGNVAPIARSFTENHHVPTSGDHLLARWGLLPPGDTIDPFTLPPHPLTAWILDLDSFRDFGAPQLASPDVPEIVKDLGNAAYRYFRWVVTDEFLQFFGGGA